MRLKRQSRCVFRVVCTDNNNTSVCACVCELVCVILTVRGHNLAQPLVVRHLKIARDIPHWGADS